MVSEKTAPYGHGSVASALAARVANAVAAR